MKIASWSLPDFLCGRDWMGWLKILSFYVIYYCLLALFAYFGIGYYSSTMPSEKPYIQGRFHSPGMQVFPAMLTGNAIIGTDDNGHKSTSEHGHTISIKKTDSAPADDSKEKFYSDVMRAWVDKYKSVAANSTVRTCSEANPQNATLDGAPCEFYENYDWIDTACGTNFGYDTGEPCFAVSLNKISNWKLQGLANGQKIPGTTPEVTGNGKNVHFHCHQFSFPLTDGVYDSALDYSTNGTEPTDGFEVEWVNGVFGDGASAQPSHGQLPAFFWPFGGNSKANHGSNPAFDKNNVNSGDKPFVILKIKRKDKNVKARANFKCHAYANNVQNSYAVVDDEGKTNFKWRVSPDANDDMNYITYQGMFALAEFSIDYSPSS